MPAPRHLRMVVLGSGSSGNATAITDGSTTVLIDCGFSAREVARRLQLASLDPSSIAAVLVTHEHSDHVRGIDVFCRRDAPGCEVFATRGTARAASLARDERFSAITSGESFSVASLTITPFRTSHDAAEPVGYRVAAGGYAIGIATDTGVMTPEAADALAGCDLLGIECNHDVRMLQTGPYPAFLKRRIGSTRGHLSNADAADAFEALAHDGLAHVIAMHRSRTNNTEGLAGDAIAERAERIGLRVPVTVAAQGCICDSDPPQQPLFDGAE